jgi:hypothetical protein
MTISEMYDYCFYEDKARRLTKIYLATGKKDYLTALKYALRRMDRLKETQGVEP